MSKCQTRRATDFRHTVTVQRITEAVNDYNEKVPTPLNVAKLGAEVVSQGGREMWRAQQVQPEATHLVKLLDSGVSRDITPEYQFVWEGKTLGIIHASKMENGRYIERHFVCKEAP